MNLKAACFILLFSVSCVPSFSGKTDNNSSIALAIKSPIESFDPVEAVDVASATVINFIHRRLYRTSVEGKLVPDLVENEVFGGGRFVVSLKKGVIFSPSGSRLKAEDVAFSIERLIASGQNSWIYNNIVNVTVLPGNRVAFQIAGKTDQQRFDNWNRQKYLLTLPQGAIYRKESYIKNGSFENCSGMTRIAHDREKIEIEYGDSRKIIFHVLPAEAVQWFYFKRGILDFYEANGIFQFFNNDTPEYGDREQISLEVLYGAIVQGSNIDLQRRSFRRDLNNLIEREHLGERVLAGGLQAADYPVPDPIGRKIAPEFSVDSYTGDKCQSKEEISIFSTADRERQLVARVVRDALTKMGCSSAVRVIDLPAMIQLNNSAAEGIYLFKWVADYPHAENFIIPLFGSTNAGSAGNRAYYQNPILDDIISREGVTEKNLEKIEKLIRADAPWVFLGFTRKKVYSKNNIPFRPPLLYTGWSPQLLDD